MAYFEEQTPKETALQILAFYCRHIDDPSEYKIAAIMATELIKLYCPKSLSEYWDSVIEILQAS